MSTDSVEKPKRPPDPAGLKAFVDDSLVRERSNVEAYDRALLTLSTASLGVSLTFIKDIVQPASAVLLPLLYAGWAMLVLAVTVTLWSFLYGLHSIRVGRDNAPRFFMQGDDTVAAIPLSHAATMRRSRYAAAALFIAGMATLAFFVVSNIHHEANVVTKENRGPVVIERGLTSGAYESFTTPQVQPTSQPAAQPAGQPAAPQGGAPAGSAQSDTGAANKE